MGQVMICDIHGGQSCVPVSSGVFYALKEKKSNNNIVFLRLLLEGELKELFDLEDDEKCDENLEKEFQEYLKCILYSSRVCYVKKEEIGVFPFIGNLTKQEDKYEYVMAFKDEPSIDKAYGSHVVCSQCFSDFVSSNPEVIYPYRSGEEPPGW